MAGSRRELFESFPGKKRNSGGPAASITPPVNHNAAKDWGVLEVVEYLRSQQVNDDVLRLFQEEKITGAVLKDITADMLHQIGVKSLGTRLLVIQKLQTFREPKDALPTVPFANILEDFKVFNDPIHGHIELHPLCVQVINTPQFQRLRHIKQLGGLEYVFPGATNNRFEHSIGVCHLAGQLMRVLQSRQPELGITDVDMLCVEIAGLCHDLGHGPFSHMFDAKFIPKMLPDINYRHEDTSVAMFEHLISKNDLRPQFESYNLLEKDLTFIKEQIGGPQLDTPNKETKSDDVDWQYTGRGKDKRFLYEIVANKRNGIDVDKWDYFVRDCHYLGIRNNFDHWRSMRFVRVLDVDGQLQICTRDKEADSVYNMFHTRSALFKTAYKHRTCSVVEAMICEAMVKANDHLLYMGENGKKYTICDTIKDMEAFTKLTDHVYHQILLSEADDLAEAREILNRLERRELYKCIGQARPDHKLTASADTMALQILECLPESELQGIPRLKPQDILVDVATFDYGMKDKDPIEHVRFYHKSSPDQPLKLRRRQVSHMLPDNFSEQYLRLYLKKTDEQSESFLKKSFLLWCEIHDINTKDGVADMNLTPHPKKAKLC